MIRRQYRYQHMAPKYAFIEACFATRGYVTSPDIVHMFGIEAPSVANVIRSYKKINPDSVESRLVGREVYTWPSRTYTRKVLKPGANGWEFIRRFTELYGMGKLKWLNG